jgi:ABC-type multidrug transport system ATPase subunit
MKSCLHKIEIRNFKAFRDFSINLEGRHLLVYGDNGAGKSSLFWALYTFLQSAPKAKDSILKYFDPSNDENLLNIHEKKETPRRKGEIKLILNHSESNTLQEFSIGQDNHGTHNDPVILRGYLASDFITYRFFFGFSDFKNSQDFNVWPLFEKEILPFCVVPGGAPRELEERWHLLQIEKPNPKRYKGPAGAKAFRNFDLKLKAYTDILRTVVDRISTTAQDFYDTHFSQPADPKVSLNLIISKDAYHSQQNKITMPPKLRFGITVDGAEVKKPQSFLNEAKMTQFALSVRFAASLVNLHTADLKLLVLDDLLVSLDMSNRMKVVEILLSSPSFANYQKLILTHDFGFFQEFKRTIGLGHNDWLFQRLVNYGPKGPSIHDDKSPLEKAEHFLANDQLSECGNQLRQHVEENLTAFLEQAKRIQGLDHLIDRKTFASLHAKLNEASNVLTLGSYKEFAEILQTEFTLDQLRDLTSAADIDPSKYAAASKAEKKAKGALIGKLYSQRPHLHQCIIELLSDASRKRLNALKLLDDVRRIKDRILNPASHSGTAPLYKKEAEDAIKIIHSLDAALKIACATIV